MEVRGFELRTSIYIHSCKYPFRFWPGAWARNESGGVDVDGGLGARSGRDLPTLSIFREKFQFPPRINEAMRPETRTARNAVLFSKESTRAEITCQLAHKYCKLSPFFRDPLRGEQPFGPW